MTTLRMTTPRRPVILSLSKDLYKLNPAYNALRWHPPYAN